MKIEWESRYTWEEKIGGGIFYSLLNTQGKKAVMFTRFTLTYEKEHLQYYYTKMNRKRKQLVRFLMEKLTEKNVKKNPPSMLVKKKKKN